MLRHHAIPVRFRTSVFTLLGAETVSMYNENFAIAFDIPLLKFKTS